MWYVIVQGVVVVQCLTVGIFFLAEKKYQRFNLYLAIYLLLKAIFSAFDVYSVVYQSDLFAPLGHVISTFFGPTLLLFTLYQFKGDETLKHRSKWLGLIPGIYVILCHFIFFKKESQVYQIDLPIDISFTFFIVFGILYINRSIAADTKMSKLRVRWLRYIFYITLFQVWWYYVDVFLTEFRIIEISSIFGWFLIILNLILVNSLILIAMRYPELTSGVSILKERIKKYPEEKYQYSSLVVEDAKEIIQKTKVYVEEQTAYKNPELSLNDVASQTGYSKKLISQTINQYLELTFKQYINNIRLEAAQKMLTSEAYSELRINEIMYESGFNSKSAFNTLFKIKTGFTPNEYRAKSRD